MAVERSERDRSLGHPVRLHDVLMDWSLNEAQAGVLSWICSTPEAEPPAGNWKASMSALVSRSLATVSKKGGRYTAAPTDAGRYFHRHGEYPADSAGGRRAARVLAEKQTRQVEPAPPEAAGASASGIPKERAANPPRRKELATTSPDLPQDAPQRIVKPHAAVRSLMERPIALPKDTDARRRAFVAAHLLIQAAEQAGFKVEGHTQPKQRGRQHPFRGEEFVTLDAGHRAVPVRIGEFEKGVNHVPTPEEIVHKERWGFSWAPRYDYLPTGLLFFRVYGDSSSTRLLESSTRWLG